MRLPDVRACILILLCACRSNVVTFTVKEPSSVRVSYISGYNLGRWRHPPVELQTEDGARVKPVDTDNWSIEAIRTTEYYLVQPGAYRLLNHRRPTIKTLRRRAARPVVGDRVADVLDASTDTNDDRGRTLEGWHIVPRHPRPYFVLIEEPTHDGSEDFSVALFDPQGNVIREKDGVSLDGPWEHVGGARWLGPLTGPVRLEVMTWGTTPRRYAFRVVQPEERIFAPITAPIGTVVRGRLGPGFATFENDDDGWGQTITFTSEHDEQVFATLWWTPDVEGFGAPSITAADENGHHLRLDNVLRDGGPGEYRYVATGVQRSDRPVRELRLHIRAHNIGKVTGRYVLCVARNATSCRDTEPRKPTVAW